MGIRGENGGKKPDELYHSCKASTTVIERTADQILNVLMNAFHVTVHKSTRALVFPSEDKIAEVGFKKDSIMSLINGLGKIIENSQHIEDTMASLERVHSEVCQQLASTIIDEVKSIQMKPTTTTMPVVTYARMTAATTQEQKHTLIIHSEDSSRTYGEIKKSINLRRNNIKLSRTPFVKDNKTVIMNFPNEEDLITMQKEVEKLKLPDTIVKHQRKSCPIQFAYLMLERSMTSN